MGTRERKGILLAMEGIDGAGKTTQIRNLETLLRNAGVPYEVTKEPTSGPWGTKIRQSAQHGRMSPEEELHAFIEDRRQHVAELIEPALAAGKVVLVDRYYLSTVAYQGARGLNIQYLLAENAFAPPPDILIVLDIEPALGLQRIAQRGDKADLFEKEDELSKIRDIFLQLDVPNLHILDATSPPEQLTQHIARLLFDTLAARQSH